MAARAFRIDVARPLGEALRRAAAREIEAAQREAASDVHEARKRCKKLRALIRLAREPLGADYARLNAALRDAGRALAGRRHHDVLIELCGSLHAALREDGWDAVRNSLRRRTPPQAEASAARARRLFAKAATALERWPTEAVTEETAAAGFVRTYRAAQRRMRKSAQAPAAANLHAWRKHAKYHGYQCALLSPRWPRLARGRVKPLKRLSDLLGEHHDLQEMLTALQAKPAEFGGSASVRRLAKRVSALQAAGAAEAQAVGERLFADSPSAWAGVLSSAARKKHA